MKRPQDSSVSVQAAASDHPPAPANLLRVLIVEDSEDACLLIEQELVRHGYSPDWIRAETRAQLQEALDRKSWDAIIADYFLPEFSASQALAMVQERGLDLPFIVISGSVGEELAASIMKSGAHDYIMKSNLTRLVPAIERELREAESRAARRDAELALKKSEARLLLAQRIGRVGSWEVDLKTGRLSWSPETFRIFGFTPDQFTPTIERFLQAVHPDDRSLVKAAADKALQEGAPYSIDHRIIRPDGSERILHEQGEVIYDADHKPIQRVGTVQDITERKTLEEQLRHSQKMKAVGQMAGGIAHDFNNILTVILGYAELISSSPCHDQEIRNHAAQIAVSAKRASKLTRQLLAFSRKQPMQLKVLYLDELVESHAGMLRKLLGEHIDLQLDLPKDLPPIRGDAGMMEQILINLAVNARDAMPHGGRFAIQLSTKEIDQKSCQAPGCQSPGSYICLEVADTGCGMDATVRSHLFEPFFTTKEVGKGTGLGLSTVYGIVQQHQGWIEVRSEPHQGTTFEIFLPISKAQTREPATAIRPGTPVPGGTETILLVEDEPALRQLAKAILVRQGYTIIEAESGPKALQAFEQHGKSIHLLLTDMIMPDGLTGCDLALKLKEKHPELRVLYSSGYSLNLVQGGVVLSEGTNFLPKPYSAVALCQAVRSCLENPA